MTGYLGSFDQKHRPPFHLILILLVFFAWGGLSAQPAAPVSDAPGVESPAADAPAGAPSSPAPPTADDATGPDLTRRILTTPPPQADVSWIEENLPEWAVEEYVFMSTWKWIGLFVVIFMGVLLDWLVRAVIRRVIRRWAVTLRFKIDKDTVINAARPAGILAMGLFWGMGIIALNLPAVGYNILALAARFVAVTAGVWVVYSFVDVLIEYLESKARKTESKLDDILIPLLRKTIKIFVLAFGLLFIAHNLQINVMSLIAGLGLGGLAFALAAKDTVENLFGSITVLIDRPFSVGDWVIVPDAKAEGTVTELGFRSTKIKTFYDSEMTVPNSQLIRATVDNMGARRYRRIRTTISITYDTPPDLIEAFCEGIRELIRKHPYTRKDFYHVYFNDFGPSSLDIMLYCFVETPDWATELRERERLLNGIVRLAAELGVEFAFPTRTLYMHSVEAPGGQDATDAKGIMEGSSEAALERGRQAAHNVARVQLGDSADPPAPVRFDT